MSSKYCVVGLGNPGPRYRHTRHNIGFDWVDAAITRIFNKTPDQVFSTRFKSQWFSDQIDGTEVHFLKPQTFMNESGRAVLEWAQKFQGEQKFLIVLDDLDLSLGKLRLRADGSDGGHRGLRSILTMLQTNEVPRLRIGIGRPQGETIDYVLEKFSPDESILVEKILSSAGDDLKLILQKEWNMAMNQINGTRFTS